MNPAISVIVPVYNAEKYLCHCVDSILAQTFTNFEVLLIDDGSLDKSGELCDEYALKDKRVHVFHKSNGGVSSARQKGIEEAKGEYVIHADPDDWVDALMLEELYERAQAENADMVICDYYVNMGKKQRYVKQQPSNCDSDTILRELFQQLHGSCWNKLVKRACYRTYEVNFPEGVNFREDTIFNMRLLKHSIRCSYLNKAFYHYVQDANPHSLAKRNSFDDDIRFLAICKHELSTEMFLEMLPYWAYGTSVSALRSGFHKRKIFHKQYRLLPLMAWGAKKRPFFARCVLFIWGIL